MLTSQSGNTELKLLKLRSITSSEVRFTLLLKYEIEPDNPHDERCSSFKRGSLFNISNQFELTKERSTPFMPRCSKEARLAIHRRSPTSKPRNPELETSRNCRLDKFPRVGGMLPLNPALDRLIEILQILEKTEEFRNRDPFKRVGTQV